MVTKGYNYLADLIRELEQPVMLLDRDLKLLAWNHYCEKLFGWSEGEVSGKYNPAISENESEQFRKDISNLLNDGAIRDMYVSRKNKSGESLNLDFTCLPIFDDGSPEYFICIYSDKSEIIKSYIGKLKDIIRKFDYKSETQEEVLLEIDEEQNVTFVSKEISSLIEKSSSSDYIGKKMNLLFSDLGMTAEEIDCFEKQFRKKVYEKTKTLEVPIFRKGNKQKIIFKLKLLYSKTGDAKYGICYIKNNYKEKSFNDFVNLISECSPDILRGSEDSDYYVASEGKVCFSKKEMFGFDTSSFGSFPEVFGSIVNKDDKKEYEIFFRDLMADDKSEVNKKIQYRITDKDGNDILISEEISKNHFSSGKPFLFSRVSDISDIISERSLVQSREELSRLNSRLLSKINLELRDPMANILGLAEILREEVSSSSELEKVEQISNSAERFMQAINSLINLYLLELSRYELNLEQLNINQILEGIANEFSPKIMNKNLYFRIETDKDLTAVGDEKLFKGILYNILNNAVAYTNKGGISITGKNVKRGENQICEITVSDTGIGMTKEKMEYIYGEPTNLKELYEVNKSETGIGLIISKKMAELMKGKILFNSVVDKGSTFTLHLPGRFLSEKKIFPKKEKTIIVNEKVSNVTGMKKPGILLVEDNVTNKMITELFIKDICEVSHALNGLQAIEMCEKAEYDLVLMDINLGPGINGIETTERIKKIKYYEKVPFVAVTGYAMPDDEERLLHLGFDEYLSKPFKKEQITKLIKKILKLD
jgi:PAS domain S-box-containing protein